MKEARPELFSKKRVVLRETQTVDDDQLALTNPFDNLLAQPALSLCAMDFIANLLALSAIRNFAPRHNLFVDHHAEARVREPTLFKHARGRGLAGADPSADAD